VGERERTSPVLLCDTHGRLNPAATGWSRHPDLTANLSRAWGRKKRWDYWCVISDELVVSCTYADIDYAGLANVWVLHVPTQRQATAGVLVPFARGFSLPKAVCTGKVECERDGFQLSIDERADATLLQVRGAADGEPLVVDLRVEKPAGHESLNVVVPWSRRRFQFTSKQNSRPTSGHVTAFGTSFELSDAWGVQDLGRGVWKYANRWNWAAASGRSTDGRIVGLQFGAKWTEGTGATENALCIDGHLTKISDELELEYSWEHPLEPWRFRGERVDLTLTPTFDRYDVTDLKVLKMEVHQCFGTWSGRIVGDDEQPVYLDGVRGFAEEARNRW
jgi:hypothetical protein